MPDAEGPPVSNDPPFIRYGSQFQSDAEILDTIANVLLKAGEGDLGENAESIAKRMREVFQDGLFGLVDPVLNDFAQTLSADIEMQKALKHENQINRYLIIRDVMNAWKEYVTTRSLTSVMMLERNRLQRWIIDLQSGMYINCVYCGHRYGPYGEKPAQAALTAHVEECEHHPLSEAKRRISDLEAQVAKLKKKKS